MEDRMSDRYFDALDSLLARVREANRESMPAGASIIADSIAADGIVHAFGSGHSQLLAIELAGRAGGLAAIQVILDPGQGKAETLEGYASIVVKDYQLESRDCLIVISNSGRNPSPIEMAMIGRERGLKVIAVTAAEFSRSVSSRHSSGRRLLDLADVILDTCGAAGDAAVHIEGAPAEAGPTSTVIGAALLNAVMVEAIAELVRRGIEPPVLVSQNVDAYAEHNEALRRRYGARIRSVT
jgi:uncharacterized phosphosugar-binding protein